jgi:ABC-type lipoprotein release transport system permease subunit
MEKNTREKYIVPVVSKALDILEVFQTPDGRTQRRLLPLVESLAACFLAAWRATRTDPVRALRE